MKSKPKQTVNKLMKLKPKVHRRLKMRATDTGDTMSHVLEKVTDKWKKYDLPTGSE